MKAAWGLGEAIDVKGARSSDRRETSARRHEGSKGHTQARQTCWTGGAVNYGGVTAMGKYLVGSEAVQKMHCTYRVDDGL